MTALIGFLLGAAALTWRFDQVLYDATLRVSARPMPDDIVIVAIDEASLAAIGRWPWQRAVHATLLDKLAAARPRAIAFDVLLSEPDPDRRQDDVLAQALRRAGKVVLPTHHVSLPTMPLRELPPIAPLRETAQLAHVDAAPDADGVVRHAFLRAGSAGNLRPHLALALLEAAGMTVHPAIVTEPAPTTPVTGASTAAWQRDARLLIRYAGPPGAARAISYASVLRGDVPPSVLNDKFVLVGATALGLGDAFPTPTSATVGLMPGVEISAQLLDALRSGHALRAAPDWSVGLLCAALALALFAAFARVSARAALAIAAATVIAMPLLSVVGVRAGWWVAPGALMLTALIAFPIWSWRRLEAASRFLDTELAHIADEPVLPTLPPLPTPALRGADSLGRRLDAVHAAGEQIRASRRFVADSFAALPEAVFVTDDALRVQIANTRAAALLEAVSPEALVGRSIDALLAPLVPLEGAEWRTLCESALNAVTPLASRARHGDFGDYLARIAPLGSGTQARGLVISLADVARLTAAERAREELLAFISHDLRSPQASLVSLVDLQRLGSTKLSPSELLDTVELLARRTLDMADNFLQLVRAETKELRIETMDLSQIVEEALVEVEPQAHARQVRLQRGRFERDLTVRGESTLVRRACTNLLVNAIKFSPPHDSVEVSLAKGNGVCSFAVSDHGPGMTPAALARLFRKYESGHPPRSSNTTNGVGLGLVFVDAVARRHGGEVKVDSAPGKGSRFELRLPAA